MGSETADDAAPPLIEDEWAVFLDVDGSLTEHAPTPTDVRIDPQLMLALPQLSTMCGGAVALVSGRSLQALDELFAPLEFAAMAGLHGIERRSTTQVHTAPAMSEAFVALARQAEAIASEHPGAVVECKGGCLFLHWRSAPDAAPLFISFAESAGAQLSQHRLHPGAHGIEIRPLGMDKGIAIAAFMQEAPFLGRRPVFIGDDRADEPGFVAVNHLNGVSVLVGDARPTAAQYRLENPRRVRQWLYASLDSRQAA